MRKGSIVRIAVTALLLVLLCALRAPMAAATADIGTVPSEDVGAGTDADTFPIDLNGDISIPEATTTVEIVLVLTILTLVPSILVMVTCFTRVVIVLSFTRNAMGAQQMPPNQVMMGLALFLTLFVMWPVLMQVKEQAWDPYTAEEITLDEAVEAAAQPIRAFMYEQIRYQGNESDLRTFIGLSDMQTQPESFEDIPTHVLIPAFMTSEIKTAFKIGFVIYLPFIVIDMVVASALMSMGMMMLPPMMIALPFKIMVFVLVDGWNLLIVSLVQTFHLGP